MAGGCCVTVVTLLLLLGVISCYNVVRKDPFASLSETLVTRQRAACDGESASANQRPVFAPDSQSQLCISGDILVLECPARTKISIQLVIYGRSAPSSQVSRYVQGLK